MERSLLSVTSSDYEYQAENSTVRVERPKQGVRQWLENVQSVDFTSRWRLAAAGWELGGGWRRYCGRKQMRRGHVRIRNLDF